MLFAADAVLLLHVLFVGFVTAGLALVLLGWARAWQWVRNPWFRLAHLIAVAVVVLQSWLAVICPLTRLEMALRARAGDAVYEVSFVRYWLEAVLYYRAPDWVFIVVYTLFGALVVSSWYWVRPRAIAERKLLGAVRGEKAQSGNANT